MNRRLLLFAAPLGVLMLSGCLAKTALDIATAPVRVAGKAADLATISQSESDEKRGRDLRKREERYGKLERQYGKQAERCRDGDERACDDAEATRRELDDLRGTIPGEYR